MAYPNIIYGDFGDERANSTTRIGNLPLGQKMILPDGSEYLHSQAGGTALVAGRLYQGEAVAAGTGNVKSIAVVAGSAQAGDRQMTITASGTGALTADQYRDGYVFASAATGGGTGHKYRIKSNAAAATTISGTVTLYDKIAVTIAGGTTAVGLRVNPQKYVLLTTADTVGVSSLAGVSCATAAASSYCWLQTKGPAGVLTDNTTLIVGTPCTASSTVAGGVGGCSAATTLTADGLGQTPVGWVLSVAASAEFSLIDLAIK